MKRSLGAATELTSDILDLQVSLQLLLESLVKEVQGLRTQVMELAIEIGECSQLVASLDEDTRARFEALRVALTKCGQPDADNSGLPGDG